MFDFYFLHGIPPRHAALHRTLDHTAQHEHVMHTKSPLLLTHSVLIHITFTSHTVSEILGCTDTGRTEIDVITI